MTSLNFPTLRQLRRVDGSSSDFTDKLYDILCGPGYVECEKNFAQDDAVWLADYLDNVRHRVALSCSPLRQPQALGYIDPSSPASRKCLSALRKVCGTREILPASYTLQSQHLGVDSTSSTFEGSRDVCEGTLGGSRVRIKRVRVTTGDVRNPAAKVYLTPPFCLSSLTQLADVLRRGGNMETPDTSKRIALRGYHYRAPPAHFELAVWWGSAGTYPKVPQHRPT